jgi:Holliday junction resolvase RusA-like endonuclease
MTVVHFTIPGPPVGKGRPRATVRGGRARMFTPEKTVNYEAMVKQCAGAAMAGAAPITGAVEATIKVTMPIPQSWSKKKIADAIGHRIIPTGKPDADNIAKAILDACNEIVFKDDAQAADLIVRKRYGEVPGVSVSINPVQAQ